MDLQVDSTGPHEASQNGSRSRRHDREGYGLETRRGAPGRIGIEGAAAEGKELNGYADRVLRCGSVTLRLNSHGLA